MEHSLAVSFCRLEAISQMSRNETVSAALIHRPPVGPRISAGLRKTLCRVSPMGEPDAVHFRFRRTSAQI